MTSTWTWVSITALHATMVLGCASRPSDEGATEDTSATDTSATGSSATGSSGTGSSSDESTDDGDSTGQDSETTGDPADCEPSDDDIGPAVEVTILNQTDTVLYLPESTECTFGSAFAISLGGEVLDWIYGICDSCADALQGLCMCPGPCAQDTVIRVDPGGRYVGSWPGADMFIATLTPDCIDECGSQCNALAQAEPGDYLASAVASPTIICDIEPCDCLDTPDPDGWCRIGNAHADAGATVEAAFAYPGETAVEITFQ
jgi:hypothetical protein